MTMATTSKMTPPDHDVVILGGGLAGLSLAIQLKQRDPGIDVVVLERNVHPVREAAFKVGESTVEIGAHYFADVLGFHDHLETEQIRKFGFRFFFSEGRTDLDRCTELGVSELLPTPSWQLDRGRFENFLGELCAKTFFVLGKVSGIGDRYPTSRLNDLWDLVANEFIV